MIYSNEIQDELYEALRAVDDYLSAPYPENMRLKKIAAEKLVVAMANAEKEDTEWNIAQY